MRRIREVFRLKHELGLSERDIATSTGMSKSSAHDYIRRADEAGLTWEQVSQLEDAVLESRLFVFVGRNEPPTRAPIDLSSCQYHAGGDRDPAVPLREVSRGVAGAAGLRRTPAVAAMGGRRRRVAVPRPDAGDHEARPAAAPDERRRSGRRCARQA